MRRVWRHYLVSFLDCFRIRTIRFGLLTATILAQISIFAITTSKYESTLGDTAGMVAIWSLLTIIIFSSDWKQLLANFVLATLAIPVGITLILTAVLVRELSSRLLGHSDESAWYFLMRIKMLGQIFGMYWFIWAFILGPKLMVESVVLHFVRFYAVRKLRPSAVVETKLAA
jgi:hypothetical protein